MRKEITTLLTTLLIATGAAWAGEIDPVRVIEEEWRAERVAAEQRRTRIDELESVLSSQMDAIRRATSDDERRTLLAEHRLSLQEALQLMRATHNAPWEDISAEHLGPARVSNVGAGHATHHPGNVKSGEYDESADDVRLADLENRIDMMQIMIESMVQSQARR